jgi:hypothetical protein
MTAPERERWQNPSGICSACNFEAPTARNRTSKSDSIPSRKRTAASRGAIPNNSGNNVTIASSARSTPWTLLRTQRTAERASLSSGRNARATAVSDDADSTSSTVSSTSASVSLSLAAAKSGSKLNVVLPFLQ